MIIKKKKLPESVSEYNITEGFCKSDGAGNIITYGIQGIIIKKSDLVEIVVHDISSKRNKVEELIEKLKRFNVNPKFLIDFVEDFLDGEYGI